MNAPQMYARTPVPFCFECTSRLWPGDRYHVDAAAHPWCVPCANTYLRLPNTTGLAATVFVVPPANDGELNAAYAMIEDLMGRLYTEAPFDAGYTALGAWLWAVLSRTDGKRCPHCGDLLGAGEAFVIGPDGDAWSPDCGSHIGSGCPSDPMIKNAVTPEPEAADVH